MEGGDHCAASRLPRVVPAILAWLRQELHGSSLAGRVLLALARAWMPRLRTV